MIDAWLSIDHLPHIDSAVSGYTYVVPNVHYGVVFRPHAESRGPFELNLEHIVTLLLFSWERIVTL